MIKIIILAIPVLCFSVLARAQKSMTLKQCIDTAIANNFDIEQRRIAEQTEYLSYKQSKLNLLPDLNGSADYSINQGRSIDPFTNSPVTQSFNASGYSLSSGLVLFSGLSKINLMKQAGLSWQAAQMELQQEKDNLSINIILAYLQVLSLAEQSAMLEAQALLSEKQVERLTALNNEGAIKPSDISDLKGQYANDQLAITDNDNDLGSAKLSLFRLMNIPYDSAVIFEKVDADILADATPQSSQSVYQMALDRLAVIKAVDLRSQSSLRALKAAKGGLWPTLRLGGDLYTQYSSVAMQSTLQSTSFVQSENYVLVDGQQLPVFEKQGNYLQSAIPFKDQLNNNLNSSITFSLDIPLFNALQQRNKIKQAQLDVKRSEVNAADTKSQLRQDIDQALLNRQTAIERYKTLLLQVNAYKESFVAAEARFTEGVGNVIDYLTAKNNLDKASRNLVNARYDYVLRSRILDFYKGRR
ncbi:MAG: TolC family protein [Niabella sp.]